MEQPGPGGAAGGQPNAGFGAQASNMALLLEFMQTYGWLILLAAIVAYFIKQKVMKNHGSRPSQTGLEYDSDTAFRRQEAMQRARDKWQEEHDAQAARKAEQRKAKEEQKRQDRIEDWDRHQEGKGYRSKVYKPKEEEPEAASASKPKPKKPLRSNDYNPLAGGSDGASCAWRPGRRQGGGGGG